MFTIGKFGRNVLSNSGANALQSVMQLALICLLFHWLKPKEFAAFLTAGYLIGLLEIASDYGGRLWAVREFAITPSPAQILKQSFGLKCCFTSASLAIFLIVPFSTLSLAELGLCLLIGFTQPSTDPFLWWLRSQERLDLEAATVVVSRLIIVCAMTLAAWLQASLICILAVFLAGNIFRMLFTWHRLYWRHSATTRASTPNASLQQNHETKYGAASTDWNLRQIAKDVFPLGTALVLTCIFQRLSLYLLENNAPVDTFNSYGMAFKFVNTSGAIATAVFVSSFAALSRAIESNHSQTVHQIIRRMLTLVTIVFVPLCFAGIWILGPLSQVVANNEARDIATVLVLLMPGLYVSCVNMGLKYTLNAYKLNWPDVFAVLLGTAALAATTLLAAKTTHWWFAGAFGWFTGESILLTTRLILLRSQQRHQGVPIIAIAGSAVTLALTVWIKA